MLAEIIKKLEAEDPNRIVPLGWDKAFSYRGVYAHLAFSPASNVTIGKMLEVAKDALDNTFEGYKGGEFTMNEYTACHLAEYGETSDDVLGPLLIDALLRAPLPAEATPGPSAWLSMEHLDACRPADVFAAFGVYVATDIVVMAMLIGSRGVKPTLTVSVFEKGEVRSATMMIAATLSVVAPTVQRMPLGYDTWASTSPNKSFGKVGATLLPLAQNKQTLSPAIKELQRLIESHEVILPDDCLVAELAQAVVSEDGYDNLSSVNYRGLRNPRVMAAIYAIAAHLKANA